MESFSQVTEMNKHRTKWGRKDSPNIAELYIHRTGPRHSKQAPNPTGFRREEPEHPSMCSIPTIQVFPVLLPQPTAPNPTSLSALLLPV